jgi:hypothetical protein
MKVAIYSRTPLAAAPFELWKALRKYTAIEARLINESIAYPDGRTFPFDIMARDREASGKALDEAAVWHVHNYWPPGLGVLDGKHPVVAQFHSLPRLGNWRDLWDRAADGGRYTIRQPLQELEYNLPALPNLIDPDEYRPAARGPKIRIAFAPSSRAAINLPCSKGYHEVRETLDRIALKRDIEIVWIEGQPYARNLDLKRSAHILIDDVVTGNFHRTSLEGACFACAVINKSGQHPWLRADLGSLERTLLELIDNPARLAIAQEMARAWILAEWHPIEGVKEYEAAYRKAAR